MTAFAEDDPRLVFILKEVLSVPPSGLIEHLTNYWWCEHPMRGLIFFKLNSRDYLHPQCTSVEVCGRAIIADLYPWARLVFVPSVFRRVNPRDYT
jgi:hypothetical protein